MFKKYRTKIVLLCLSTFSFNGCVDITTPKNDIGFKKITEIKQIQGCYMNLAETGNDSTRYLSSILFSNIKYKHTDIKFICIKALNKESLNLTAKNSNKNILSTKNLTKNKDFILESGRIIISNNDSYAIDNVLGVSSESIIFGVDKNEDGKLIKKGGGVIVFPIPFAVYYNYSYRFKKSKIK